MCSLDHLQAPDVALTVLPRDQRRNLPPGARPSPRSDGTSRGCKSAGRAASRRQSPCSTSADRRLPRRGSTAGTPGFRRRRRAAAWRASWLPSATLNPVPAMTGSFPRASSTMVPTTSRCSRGRERVELAGAAGGDNRRQWMLEHHPDVLPQRLEIDREIGLERRDRKTDDARERVAKGVG